MVASVGTLAAGVVTAIVQHDSTAAGEADKRGQVYSLSTAIAGVAAAGAGALGGVGLLLGSRDGGAAWLGAAVTLAGVAVSIPITRVAIDVALSDDRSPQLPSVSIQSDEAGEPTP